MVKSEVGGVGRSFLVAFLVLAVLGLCSAVVYLLSDLNHRRFRLAVHESTLLVERGRMFPFGFARFEPKAADLKAGYAPIPVPPGESINKSEIYEDRADIDRSLFALLASWARERLDSNEPGDFELGASYIRRCELLPGLSEEQRIEMRTLRADLAFRSGRRILNEIVTRLEKAHEEFETAKQLGTSRPQDVEKWIADVERRIRDYKASHGPHAPALAEQPELAPPANSGSPAENPPTETSDESNPPKWRL
ncbi:hypothetical protein ACFL6C_12890 [Myxococcota bacterium]